MKHQGVEEDGVLGAKPEKTKLTRTGNSQVLVLQGKLELGNAAIEKQDVRTDLMQIELENPEKEWETVDAWFVRQKQMDVLLADRHVD